MSKLVPTVNAHRLNRTGGSYDLLQFFVRLLVKALSALRTLHKHSVVEKTTEQDRTPQVLLHATLFAHPYNNSKNPDWLKKFQVVSLKTKTVTLCNSTKVAESLRPGTK